jgi:hypothetical protein
MVRSGSPLSALPRITDTWKYALVGGIVSLPLTLWQYWQSGLGSEFSLDMVFVGGLTAGYLAARAPTETSTGSVGLRAGVIGALPGLSLVGDLLHAAVGWASPLWFRAVAVVLLAGGVSLVLFAFGGLVGAVGAKIGGWVAVKAGTNRTPPVGN